MQKGFWRKVKRVQGTDKGNAQDKPTIGLLLILPALTCIDL